MVVWKQFPGTGVMAAGTVVAAAACVLALVGLLFLRLDPFRDNDRCEEDNAAWRHAEMQPLGLKWSQPYFRQQITVRSDPLCMALHHAPAAVP